MNSRAAALLIALSVVAPTPTRADLSGRTAATCGGVLRTIENLEKSIAERLAPSGFTPFSFSEPNLGAFAKHLDRFDQAEAKVARKKIADFRARSADPKVRTNAMVFAGEGAVELLKKSSAEAREIGAQARKNLIFKKGVIGAFGALSLFKLADIPVLLEMPPDRWWYTVPAALFAIEFGKPVVQALLRLKKSPLEKFMTEEFAKIGTVAKDESLHMLTMTGRKTSDYRTLIDLDENARAPYVQQMVFDSRPWGLTRLKRILRGKNPFVLPAKTIQIDLIALPYGTGGDRQILVLTAEGI